MSPEVKYYHELLFDVGQEVAHIESDKDLSALSLSPKLVVIHNYSIPSSKQSLPKLVLEKSNPKTIIFKSQIDFDRFKTEVTFSGESYVLPYPVKEVEPVKLVPGRVLFYGGCSVEHRAHKVLEAISKMQEAPELSWLVDGDIQRAESLVREFGVKKAKLKKRQQVSDWQDLINEGASLAIHTYFSAFGDPGPYPAISMMNGLPIIVSDMGYGAALPESTAAKVSPGVSEVEELIKAISSITLKNSLNDAGLSYALESCSELNLKSEVSNLNL